MTMKTITHTLLGAAIGAALSIAPVAPAQSATPHCIHDVEYAKVEPGKLKHRVHRITETRGDRWEKWADGRVTRRYWACDNNVAVKRFITYRKVEGKWRVVASCNYRGYGAKPERCWEAA